MFQAWIKDELQLILPDIYLIAIAHHWNCKTNTEKQQQENQQTHVSHHKSVNNILKHHYQQAINYSAEFHGITRLLWCLPEKACMHTQKKTLNTKSSSNLESLPKYFLKSIVDFK